MAILAEVIWGEAVLQRRRRPLSKKKKKKKPIPFSCRRS